METDPVQQARIEVARIMTRLYEHGLTTTSGGNVSLRFDANTVLITAAATDKGRMSAGEVAVLSLDGTNQTPSLKPSSETAMHLEILRHHSHVHAIAHAHPPAACTFTVVDRKLNCRLLAESYAVIGEPAIAPYALTGTPDLARSVSSSLLKDTACVLMENHGVLTVGRTLLEAFDRMEVLENAARINIYAAALGGARELSPERCQALDALMGRGPTS